MAYALGRRKINYMHTLRDEILRQLETDILSYGWLRQLAKSDSHGSAESRHHVLDLVSALVDDGLAVVGLARSDDNMVVIYPWSERGEALKERMAREVDNVSPDDKDWVFWIQLSEHYKQ